MRGVENILCAIENINNASKYAKEAQEKFEDVNISRSEVSLLIENGCRELAYAMREMYRAQADIENVENK